MEGHLMSKKWVIFLLVVLFTFTLLLPVLAESQVKVLKVGITKDENTLTPYTYVTGYPGLDLVNLLYDNLFQLDDKNQPQPWLVKEYNVSDDGLVYNLTLYENLKWQDGKPLTMDDVMFTMDYFLEHPKSRFTNPLKKIVEVKVNDPLSLTITLSQATPNFIIQPLADLPILPKHIWSEITDPDNATNALGSGPYILTEYKKSQYYKMKANQEYFKGEPVINEIVFPIIEDRTALYTALQAGEVDAISADISPELVNQFESNPKLKVNRGPGYSTTLFQVNAERYPMTEKSFRQAIAYAIDTQYLVDTVLLGFAETGSMGFIHPSSPFYNEHIIFQPNLERAKELLEQAGFVDKDGDGFREDQQGKKLELTTLVYSDNPIRIRTAEIVSDWLKQIGLNVTVKAMDSTTVDSLMWPDFDVAKGRDFDLAIWGWSNTMQLFPDRILELFHTDPNIGSVNIGGYSNEQFDQLADTLRNTINPDDRMKLIKEIQAFVADEAPIVTLYYPEIVNAYNPNVYDGYTFQLGKGIINKLSLANTDPNNQGTTGNGEQVNPQDNSQQTSSQPVNGQASTAKSSGSNWALVILLVVVIVIIGGIFLIKKKTR